MKNNIYLILFLSVITVPASVTAGQVQGKAINYSSPAGVTEQCIALAPMPGAIARPGDKKQEQKYCGINFYDGNTALCPKTWSTSPGTIVFDLSSGSYADRVNQFEKDGCKLGKGVKKTACCQGGQVQVHNE